MKYYTKIELKNTLEQANYTVIGDVGNLYDKVLCINKDGYKVFATPGDIKRRRSEPVVFSKYNEYTIENMNVFLIKNNLPIELTSTTYFNSTQKLNFKCECGRTFKTTWQTILGGKKCCNYCAKSKRYDTKCFTDYYKLVEDKCIDSGYVLLTDQKITRNRTKFKYICKKHYEYGVQESTPENMVKDYGNGGCYLCGIEKRSISKRKPDDFFKTIVENAGMIFCGVDRLGDTRTRVLYKCPKHIEKGVLSTYITNMKKNNGKCPYCIGRDRTINDLQAELNNMNSQVTIIEYSTYSSPIKAKCNLCGFEWITQGCNLTQGHRCPNCNKSKFELSVESILNKFNVEYETQYKFDECRNVNPLPFDFYLKNYNVLIEVDGEDHYIPIKRSSSMTDNDMIKRLNKIRQHDRIKTSYCNKNNIRLIRIPYWEKDNMENYLINKLEEYNVNIS